MRDTMAYERPGGARSGGGETAGYLRAGFAEVRRFVQALLDELRHIPDYQDHAEALREGLRRAHSNRRERDR